MAFVNSVSMTEVLVPHQAAFHRHRPSPYSETEADGCPRLGGLFMGFPSGPVTYSRIMRPSDDSNDRLHLDDLIIAIQAQDGLILIASRSVSDICDGKLG